MLVGLRIIIIVAIMGGIIAFIGDKLGTKVGKRKMSLFGLRPKHTSIIVTIVTGILISAATLSVLAISSQNVRTALFGMDRLKAEMAQLNSEIEAKNKELAAGNEALANKNKELQTVQDSVKATNAELEETRSALAARGNELVSIQDAYSAAEEKLAASNGEVKELASVRDKLQNHISDLQITTKQLEEGISKVREGNVVFRNGEVLSAALIRPGLTMSESEVALAGFLNDTNRLILQRFNMTGDKMVIYVSRQNIEEVSKQIENSTTPMTVRVTATANIIYGEPALAELQAYPQTLIFDQGHIISSEVVDMNGADPQQVVLNFLKSVNAEAKERGVLPDPITGEVGSLPGNELFATIRHIEGMKGRIKLEAIAREDTYTSGPVHVLIRVSQVDL